MLTMIQTAHWNSFLWAQRSESLSKTFVTCRWPKLNLHELKETKKALKFLYFEFTRFKRVKVRESQIKEEFSSSRQQKKRSAGLCTESCMRQICLWPRGGADALPELPESQVSLQTWERRRRSRGYLKKPLPCGCHWGMLGDADHTCRAVQCAGTHCETGWLQITATHEHMAECRNTCCFHILHIHATRERKHTEPERCICEHWRKTQSVTANVCFSCRLHFTLILLKPPFV